MGLIKAAMGSAGGVLADQWKEYFYCEALPMEVLAVKGKKRTSRRSSNTKGSDNIITSGSVIAVADGQCMLIVDQGKVVEVCAEPGEYTYDASSEPSIFAGGLNKKTIKSVMATMGSRFTFGGEAPKDQRIYYFNTKEIMGNKYGTANPIPFRVTDESIGLRTFNVSIRCFGEYSYKLTNPVLFYSNVCGNFSDDYKRSEIESMMKSELLMRLQEAFARISEKGILYTALPGYAGELAEILNDILSDKWRDMRGIEIVSFGVSSVKADEEDEKTLKDLQRAAALSNPGLAAGHMVGAQAAAMQDAANNPNGAGMAFMGMGMAAGAGGINTQSLFQMAAQQQSQPMQQTSDADSWQCSCGKLASGKFCMECGAKKPQPKPVDGWTCPKCGHLATGKFCMECGEKKPEAAQDGWVCPTCGKQNKGKFCGECGTKKPAGVPQYRCDKCGWEPEDPKNPPKFCPECGDPFGDEDMV